MSQKKTLAKKRAHVHSLLSQLFPIYHDDKEKNNLVSKTAILCGFNKKKTKCLVCKKKYNSPFKISVKKASKKTQKNSKKKVLSKSAFAYSKNISLSAFLVFQTISLPPYF